MPFIKDKFPTFFEFASSDLEQIYSKEKLDRALHYQVSEFRNGILMNNKGNLEFKPFPAEAQLSFINAYQVADINGDGLLDVIGVGNRFNSEVETTRYDAGAGLVLIQTTEGGFKYIPPIESGFYAHHNAKSLEMIKIGKEGKPGFLVGNNNQRAQLFLLEQPE